MSPFRPTKNGTIRLQANTVQGAATLLANLPHGGGTQVRVWNRGTVPFAVEFGSKPAMDLPLAPTAGGPDGGSMSIAPGAVEFVTLQFGERFAAVTAFGGTPDVEITVGQGS